MPDPETEAARLPGAPVPERRPARSVGVRGRRITTSGLALALVPAVAAGAGTAVVAALPGGAPEVGVLEPVAAQPPEQSEERPLGRGATLVSVLGEFGLERRDRNGLVLAFREVADPRSLRPDVIVARRWRHDPALPHSLDVVLDPDRTVRLARSAHGWTPKMLLTPTTTDTLAAAGEIEAGSSLWLAVNQNAALSEMVSEDQGELIHGLDRCSAGRSTSRVSSAPAIATASWWSGRCGPTAP